MRCSKVYDCVLILVYVSQIPKMSSTTTGLPKMLADAAILSANRKKGREHVVGPQIWPVVQKSSPIDLTRIKDTLLRWILSSLLQFHPERMLWLYSKIDDLPENR